jgi:hypothetical protein
MTAPYTTGTVSLTNGSAVITGIGTAWAAALIAGGTVYVEADGNPMPILTVNSETQITAAIKWKGATGTYPYAIMRDTAYGQQTVANANALATYIQRLNNEALAALATLDPAADKLPFFNGEATAALATLTAFARTLLDDASAADMRNTLGVKNLSSAGSLSWVDGSLVVRTNGTTVSVQRNNANRVDVEAFDTANTNTKHAIDLNRYGGEVTAGGQLVWHNGNVAVNSGSSGYIKFPNGILIQWGFDNSGVNTTVTFPIAYTTIARPVAIPHWAVTNTQLAAVSIGGITTTKFDLYKRIVEGGSVTTLAAGTPWISIGH